MPTTSNELSQILKFLDAQRPTAPSDATRVEEEEYIPQLRIPGQDQNFYDKEPAPKRETSMSNMPMSKEELFDMAMGMVSPGGAAKKTASSVKDVLAQWKGKNIMEGIRRRKEDWSQEVFGGRFDDAGKFTKAKGAPKDRPHYIPETVGNKKVYTVDPKLGSKRYDYVPKLDLKPNSAKQSFSGQQQSFVDGQYTINESVKAGAMKDGKIFRMKHRYTVSLNDKFANNPEVAAISFTSRMGFITGTKKAVPIIENIHFASGKKIGPEVMNKSLDNLSDVELKRVTIGASKMIQSFASRFPDGTIIRFGLDKNGNSLTLDSFNFMISAVAKYAKRILMSPEWKHQVLRKYDSTGATSALSKMSQEDAAKALVKKFKAKLGDKAYGTLEISPSKMKEGRPFEMQKGALDVSSFEIEMKGRLAAMIGIPLSQVDDMLQMIEEDTAR